MNQNAFTTPAQPARQQVSAQAHPMLLQSQEEFESKCPIRCWGPSAYDNFAVMGWQTDSSGRSADGKCGRK